MRTMTLHLVFTLDQYRRLRAAGLSAETPPGDAVSWVLERVEHAAVMDEGAGRLGELIDALDAPGGVGAVEYAGMLRELVVAREFAVGGGGIGPYGDAWVAIDNARKPPRPVPTEPGQYWGSWDGGEVYAVRVDDELKGRRADVAQLCRPVDRSRWTWEADPDDRSKPWRVVFPGGGE